MAGRRVPLLTVPLTGLVLATCTGFVIPPTAASPTTCARVAATKVGTPDRDTLTGTNGRDVISAAGNADSVSGEAGDDLLCGDDGHDVLEGGPGADLLAGGNGTDTLIGGDGDDVLYGGASVNALYGGAGNDTVYALNASPDVISCGNGVDRVTADRFDLVDLDCEKVTLLVTNSPPSSLTLSNASVPENEPVDTIVGILIAGDPDVNDSSTYSLVPGEGGSGNALFRIDGTMLRTVAVLDFEVAPKYSIRVRATDSGGQIVEKVFTIKVRDVAETPADALSNPITPP